jgi:hypothetical protein
LSRAPWVAFAALVVACQSTQPDEGRDAAMQVAGAQFFRGAMPVGGDGPGVASIELVSTAVQPGMVGKTCGGALEASATAAALMLSGDLGYWILPAGPSDVSSPGFPGYKTELSFAGALAPGARALLVSAVDAAGRFGSPRATTLTVFAPPRPSGALVVSLTWSNLADLDLHVVDPGGVEIFSRHPSSYPLPPPGSVPPPPDMVPTGYGLLDHDAQAGCVPEGISQEDVVWTDDPPRGRYVVRVDTVAMCGEPSAYWHVEAFLHGKSLGAAAGISTDVDMQFSHDRGAGLLALELDVP